MFEKLKSNVKVVSASVVAVGSMAVATLAGAVYAAPPTPLESLGTAFETIIGDVTAAVADLLPVVGAAIAFFIAMNVVWRLTKRATRG